jgi:hypothetical protein
MGQRNGKKQKWFTGPLKKPEKRWSKPKNNSFALASMIGIL